MFQYRLWSYEYSFRPQNVLQSIRLRTRRIDWALNGAVSAKGLVCGFQPKSDSPAAYLSTMQHRSTTVLERLGLGNVHSCDGCKDWRRTMAHSAQIPIHLGDSATGRQVRMKRWRWFGTSSWLTVRIVGAGSKSSPHQVQERNVRWMIVNAALEHPAPTRTRRRRDTFHLHVALLAFG